MRASRILTSIALAAALSLAAAHAQDSTGAISGRVVDDFSGNALPGATVHVVGTASLAVTDRSGGFRISGVAAGSQQIEVSYLGFKTKLLDVQIEAGRTIQQTISLEVLSSEEVTVLAEPFREGQARALNQQRNAPNMVNIVSADQIGRFPDPNAAEATQRVPGVTLQRDQGEGRFVIVRGIEPRLTSVSINGERIPAPEGDVRFVALDVIPADILQSIEVSKTLTAEMDGEAIGGNVNLVAKRAPESPFLTITAGLGYNEIVQDDLQVFNLAAGRRFLDDKLGLIFAASYQNTDRGSDNFEVEYDEGQLEELELRDYQINRERIGFVGGFDYRLANGGEFYANAIFNEFDDQEFRRRVRNKVGDNEIVRQLKDRFESQQIISFNVGSRHFFDQGFQADWEFTYSHAEESEPQRVDSDFIQEDVEFDPNVTPSRIDPDNIQANPLNEDLDAFVLDEITLEDNTTSDQDFVFKVNLGQSFVVGDDWTGVWKVGAKFRFKDKERDNNTIVAGTDEDIFLNRNLDLEFDSGDFFEGRYQAGRFPDAEFARELAFSLPDREKDIEEDLADYEADENIYAYYGQVELNLGPKLQIIPGLRVETTDIDYVGRELVFDDEGEIASVTDLRGENDYTEVLPSFNMRYALGADTNIRAAATRSLSRPNHEDLVPFQLILQEDQEIERGNPELDPTESWNFDLLAEKYFNSVGIVSGGVFFKSITDAVFIGRSEEIRDGEEFEVTQPFNAEDAHLFGLEFAYQQVFDFLPGALNGLGLYANYTWTGSEADLPGRIGIDSDLPGQAQNVFNFAVSYEKAGFSGRISWNFHDEYLSEVGGAPSEDIFIDDHLQLDLFLSQRITKNVRFFAEIINLTDEPFRRFEASNDRPVQEEIYSWWGTFGLKIDF